MKGFRAFFQKEWMESLRAYRVLILLAVFGIFGLMNPLTAKLTPALLEALMPEGVSITLPEPSAYDSWAQFFKNISQMGLIVVVLLYGGIIGRELSQGTLVLPLTRGLSRGAVVLAKATCMLLLWTAAYAFSFLVTWGYTAYLFPADKPASLLLAAWCMWLFGVFLLSLLMLLATLTRSGTGCLLLTGGALALLFLLQMIPGLAPWNPLALASENMGLLQGTTQPLAVWRPAVASGLGAALCVAGGMWVFRRLGPS